MRVVLGRKKIEEWRKGEEFRRDTRMRQRKELLELGLFPFLTHIPLFLPLNSVFSPFPFTTITCLLSSPSPFPAQQQNHPMDWAWGEIWLRWKTCWGGHCCGGRIRVQLFSGEGREQDWRFPSGGKERVVFAYSRQKLVKEITFFLSDGVWYSVLCNVHVGLFLKAKIYINILHV